MTPPIAERIDLHIHSGLKARIIAECQKRGVPMNDFVTEAVCLVLRLKAEDYAVPRRLPGRPAGTPNRKKKRKE